MVLDYAFLLLVEQWLNQFLNKTTQNLVSQHKERKGFAGVSGDVTC